ncbi:hypothetical protein HXX27_01590 [Weissella confusa]|uniref:hypothetical protein n=1 Tax=Weissella confusa TaxID=1583 RepID=UPI0018A32ECE|nr:hypothetical protein [Weissella confusa]MBF7055426.1 hypothetical protein [Weissella confusa]
MKINVRTTFDAELSAEKVDDDGNKQKVVYATFNGNINSDGMPQVSYYIPDNYVAVYKENIAEFRKQWTKFQDIVFKKADEVTSSLNAATTEA